MRAIRGDENLGQVEVSMIGGPVGFRLWNSLQMFRGIMSTQLGPLIRPAGTFSPDFGGEGTWLSLSR